MAKLIIGMRLGVFSLLISVGIMCGLPTALQSVFMACQPTRHSASANIATGKAQGLTSSTLAGGLVAGGTIAVAAALAFGHKRVSKHHRQSQRRYTVQATTSQSQACHGRSCRECHLMKKEPGLVTEVAKTEACAASSPSAKQEAKCSRAEDVFGKLGGPRAAAPFISSVRAQCAHPDREFPNLCGDCPRDLPVADGDGDGGGGCCIS